MCARCLLVTVKVEQVEMIDSFRQWEGYLSGKQIDAIFRCYEHIQSGSTYGALRNLLLMDAHYLTVWELNFISGCVGNMDRYGHYLLSDKQLKVVGGIQQNVFNRKNGVGRPPGETQTCTL